MRIPGSLSAIGMPWHGLATDGKLPTTADGDKDITDRATWIAPGVAIPVRHPSAPGANRNTAEAAFDSARGLEWRDYALLCGPGHAVNGGPEIGVLRWLYCDTGGATWVVRLGYTKNTDTIDFEVWLDAIFGRWPAVDFTPRLLASLTWSPVTPNHFNGGDNGFTFSDIVQGLDLERIETLAFTPDGSQCFANLVCTNDTVNKHWYPTQTPFGDANDTNQFAAVAAVLRIDISGTGDEGGAGIAATFVEDAHINGLVIAVGDTASSGENGNSTLGVSEQVDDNRPSTVPDPVTDPTQYTRTKTHTPLNSMGASGTYTRQGRHARSVVYRTPAGDVIRDYIVSDVEVWTRSVQGSFTKSRTEANWPGAFETGDAFNAGGGWWYSLSSEVASGTNLCFNSSGDREYHRTETLEIFGQLSITYDHKIAETTTEGFTIEPAADWQGNFIDPGSCPPEGPHSTQVFINGVAALANAPGDLLVEYRILAPNCLYVAAVTGSAVVAGQYDMHEHIVVANDQGVPAELWNGTYQVASLPVNHPMPLARELALAYNPVSGDLTHGQQQLGVAYAGPRRQYV